jgi:hypothetical protein
MKNLVMICVAVGVLAVIVAGAIRLGIIPADFLKLRDRVVYADPQLAAPIAVPSAPAVTAPPSVPPPPPAPQTQTIVGGSTALRAAIFVQNRASADFQKYSGSLTDLITTKLTEKGLSIIDKDLVVKEFANALDSTRAERKAKVDDLAAGKTEATVEDVLSTASALRLAQMLNADYLVVASITSVGSEKHIFSGKNTSYGVNIESKTYTLRMSLRILDRSKGGTFYGKTVTATKTVSQTDISKTDSTDLVNELLDDASTQIVEQLNTKLALPSDSLVPVDFALACNIVNATVELDGAVIGTIGPLSGKFSAMPGLHRMRVSREWFATWDKDVNIFANQTLTIQLELSDIGFKRSKDSLLFAAELEKEKAELANAYQAMALRGLVTTSQVAIATVQSDAEAYAKMKISEGWKTCLEHSTLPAEERSQLHKQVNVLMGR